MTGNMKKYKNASEVFLYFIKRIEQMNDDLIDKEIPRIKKQIELYNSASDTQKNIWDYLKKRYRCFDTEFDCIGDSLLSVTKDGQRIELICDEFENILECKSRKNITDPDLERKLVEMLEIKYTHSDIENFKLSIGNLSPNTQTIYSNNALKFLNTTNKRIGDLTFDDFLNYFSEIESSLEYKKSVYSALSKFCVFLYENNVINKNYMVDIPRPGTKREEEIKKASKAQKIIIQYLELKYKKEKFTFKCISDSIIYFTDTTGTKKKLTCNLFGDIMEYNSKHIIAESNLPHTLDKLDSASMPTAWKDIEP